MKGAAIFAFFLIAIGATIYNSFVFIRSGQTNSDLAKLVVGQTMFWGSMIMTTLILS